MIKILMRQPGIPFAWSPPIFRHQLFGSPRWSWHPALTAVVMCPVLRIFISLQDVGRSPAVHRHLLWGIP